MNVQSTDDLGLRQRKIRKVRRFFSLVALPILLSVAACQSGCVGIADSVSKSGTAANSASQPGTAANSPNKAGTHFATLSWTASISAVNSYVVYRASHSGGPYTRLNASTQARFTDRSVEAGQTYYDVVTAVDSSYRVSSFSKEVAATIPTPRSRREQRE
jgi:hypothetical protein